MLISTVCHFHKFVLMREATLIESLEVQDLPGNSPSLLFGGLIDRVTMRLNINLNSKGTAKDLDKLFCT